MRCSSCSKSGSSSSVREARRLRTSSTPFAYTGFGADGSVSKREDEDRRVHRVRGRRHDLGEDAFEVVLGDEVADGLVQRLEACGQDLDARLEELGGRAGLVGEPTDAVFARGRAVARARFVHDLGPHAEQLGECSSRGPRPTSSTRGMARSRSAKRSCTTHSVGPTAPPSIAMTGARLAPPDSTIIREQRFR